MKNETLKNIANTIVRVAREEDLILHRGGKGIFLIPELAFVYSVGRALALDADRIFSTSEVKWLPETTLGAAGRTDLVFEVERQRTFAIEFKCAGKAEDYTQDIRKLASLDPVKYERIFVALIDTWPQEIDPNAKIQAVEKESGIPTEGLSESERFDFFSTLHQGYVKQVCCVVGLWRIASKFHMPWSNSVAERDTPQTVVFVG